MSRRGLGSYGGNPTDWSLTGGVHTLQIGPHKLKLAVENDSYSGWIDGRKVLEGSTSIKAAKRKMKELAKTDP